MKINLNESISNIGEYIGGKLSDISEQADFETEEGEDAYFELIEERAETINDYILDFSSYYIRYSPDNSYSKFELCTNDYAVEVWEILAIKEGVDLIAYPNYLKAVGYYGRREDVVYLYPISEEKADELSEIIDNADFGESDVIETEIAQYTYNGASVEDVLKSLSVK